MKKLLFTTLFIAFAMTLGFCSTLDANKQEATTASAYSYQYINYYVGDLQFSYEFWGPTFTVNYGGEYLGCEGYVARDSGVSSYTFCALETYQWGKRDNVHIGNVVTRQNGQVVIYQIYANIK